MSSWAQLSVKGVLLTQEKVKPRVPLGNAPHVGKKKIVLLNNALSKHQRRIKDAAVQRLAVLKDKVHNKETQPQSSKESEEDSDDESPVQPRCMRYTDSCMEENAVNQTESSKSEVEDDRIYYPNDGEPFSVVQTYDILPDICCTPILPPIITEALKWTSTVEVTGGTTTVVSECKRLYKENNNSIPHLLSMCIGLYDDLEGQALADFEEDPLYKQYLEKSAILKVPLLKAKIQRRAKAAGMKKLRKTQC